MATADSRMREEHGLELAISGSPCPRGLVGGSSSHGAQWTECPRSTKRPASLGRSTEAVRGADDSILPPRSRARSTDSASTLSAPQEADSGTVLRRLQSLIIRGGGSPDVQVSLTAGGAKDRPRPWWRSEGQCDNPPRKIPYYRLRPIHFGH
jgi:hypothetical protein